MDFQALTGAPMLVEGVRLNIMAVPQNAGQDVARLSLGDHVVVRCGHCCPDIAEGIITARSDLADRAVLSVCNKDFTIERGRDDGGVLIAGIISEDWFVR